MNPFDRINQSLSNLGQSFAYRRDLERQMQSDRRQDLLANLQIRNTDRADQLANLQMQQENRLAKKQNIEVNQAAQKEAGEAALVLSQIQDPNQKAQYYKEHINYMKQTYGNIGNMPEEYSPQLDTLISSVAQKYRMTNPGKLTPVYDPQKGISTYTTEQEALGKQVPPKADATPNTDVDDFVDRANKQAMLETGKPLTPGEQNEAALTFKRAQAPEVAANRLAEKEIDAQTEATIKYNGEKGKILAQIELAPKLTEAKGEVTPQQKKVNAKKGVSGKLATLANHYLNLDSMNAIVNVDKPTMENIFAAMRSSKPGQMFGRATGTEAQSIRNSIERVRPLLLQDIRQSTDMSAKGLDSEKELEFYLQAATDPAQDIQSNIAAIVVLDESFGDGEVAKQLREYTNESLIKRISTEGQQILGGNKSGERPPVEGARKAPDGNWYIEKDGKYYKVD